MEFVIPNPSGESLSIPIEQGTQLFVVGANGSGKSALIQHFVTSSPDDCKIKRISAHRQTWLPSGSLALTPQERREFADYSMRSEKKFQNRWKDTVEPSKRLSAALFDLVAAENSRARKIASHIDEKRFDEATAYAQEVVSPFNQLNELLALGALKISLENSNDEEIIAKHRSSDTSFSIAQMSDGERNAAIIAADVLTVQPETVLLIDEPERHLHRSIIVPFLSALFAQRNDCAFVISTHEIALPVANPEARVLMLRSCAWAGETPKAWDVEVLELNAEIPEDLKRDILGSRRKILFVEGTANSLDQPLYSVLFPEISVIAKGSCSDVERAVIGLQNSKDQHHVEAFGLIDRDDRSEDEIRKLAEKKIFALNVCAVESLYYCSDAIAAVAQGQAELRNDDPGEMIRKAMQSAMEVINEKGLPERMSAKRCERRVRNKLQSRAPDWKEIQRSGEQRHICLTVDNPYVDELKRFQDFTNDKRLDDLVARYPLKESRVFHEIAKSLKCEGRNAYERIVVSCVKKNGDLAFKLKQRIESLSKALDAMQPPVP